MMRVFASSVKFVKNNGVTDFFTACFDPESGEMVLNNGVLEIRFLVPIPLVVKRSYNVNVNSEVGPSFHGSTLRARFYSRDAVFMRVWVSDNDEDAVDRWWLELT